MHLISQLKQRQASGKPVRVVLIGSGKFGCMYLAQAVRTPGVHIAAVVDLDVPRCRAALARIGWPADRFAAAGMQQALDGGATYVTDRSDEAINHESVDVVIEATGSVPAAVEHGLMAIAAGKHVVMVTVEADAVVGPVMAARAKAAGVVYSMAYGDQPAMICEMVDWARTCGFEVTCAGKGTKYLPEYHKSTPDTVWKSYGFSAQQVASGDYNARMFNSFLDGTKSALEMAAVANATGLQPQSGGLSFPPCPVHRLASICVPRSAGGMLERSGTVEVVSSLYRDGSEIDHDLRWGVYVTFESDSEYVQRCFKEYGAPVDASGRYAAVYKPNHFIGLELGYSVARAALGGEATGTPRALRADVAAVAKRDLRAGERLDGEGGYTVYGRLVPAEFSLARGVLPIGLASELVLKQHVEAGQVVTWADVSAPAETPVLALRRELEALSRKSQKILK